jgi:2-haloacid dehalogenase
MTAARPFTEIDACLFDAFGTLFDVHAPAQTLADRLGDQADAVSSLWRQKQIQYTWLRSLMDAYVPFGSVTAEALDHALGAHNIGGDGLRDDLLAAYRRLAPYPEVAPSLAHLRACGVPTGILSNGERNMVTEAARHAGIGDSLDHVLSAEDVGVFKPHARVYQLGPDALGTPAHRICFVSANAWDVAGAAHFGYAVIWVNRFGQTRENLPGAPKAICARVDVVPQLLGHGRPAGLDAGSAAGDGPA